MAQLKSQLSVMAEIGGRGAMTPASYGMFSRRLPPFEPPRSPEQDRQILVDALESSAGTPPPKGCPSSWSRSTGTRTTW